MQSGIDGEWLGFERDHHWGCFDNKGKIVVPFEYDSSIQFDENGLAVLRQAGVSSVLNSVGQILPQSTSNSLSAMQDDLPYTGSHSANYEALYTELSAGRFLEAEESDGYGVFSAIDGMIVPTIHAHIEMTRYGFRGRGDKRPWLFDKYVPALSRWITAKIPAFGTFNDDLEVLYDFNGREIWQSDTWLFDRFKASCIAIFGVFCFWRSWHRK